MVQLLFYKPHKTAAAIKCPLLLVALEDDILCPVEGCDMISRAASQKVELLRLPNCEYMLIVIPTSPNLVERNLTYLCSWPL